MRSLPLDLPLLPLPFRMSSAGLTFNQPVESRSRSASDNSCPDPDLPPGHALASKDLSKDIRWSQERAREGTSRGVGEPDRKQKRAETDCAKDQEDNVCTPTSQGG